MYFAVRRNGHQRSLAGFRNFGDGDILEGNRALAIEQSVNAVAAAAISTISDERGYAGSELVLAGGGNHG